MMLEILAPSGNEECAEVAIQSGANAIYLGYTAFSARYGADNFDETALLRILQKAHVYGVKIYLAMNTVVKTTELDGFLQTLIKVWNMGVDAIILQDLFLGKYLHRLYPEIVLHLSTQAGVCTEEGGRLAKECGFSRVILARETPLAEIEKITKIIETEVFVQGALCTCFSGQCYFSSFVGGNSGNRGRCKQPCRKQYSYNRNGYESKSYALSLSDLSVGADIEQLIQAGVTSFKIEGRMRRKEYVGAAVRYYRQLLLGENVSQTLSDLKRAYNRGNYTKGLAFGQDKRFLSRAVQGHIGEKVGVVKVEKGRFLVESAFRARQGDAFKILRDGVEIGGAAFGGTYSRGFVLYSKTRLLAGDNVFVTTDTQANERILGQQLEKRTLSIELSFTLGERAMAKCGEVILYSDAPLAEANSSYLTEEDVKTCFLKTDAAPFMVEFLSVKIDGKIFLPKSMLNAFRRAFYAKVLEYFAKGDRGELTPLWSTPTLEGKNEKLAVISDDFDGIVCDVAIWKPTDSFAAIPESILSFNSEKYLYLPPFHTAKDIEWAKDVIGKYSFDGLYADNYDGVKIAEELGCKLFAGTGFNLTNVLSVAEVQNRVSYYAVSKELSETEAEALRSNQAFALAYGDIKIMDLCYCPFERTCNRCDRKTLYRLTDENGREFPVRRYVDGAGVCRFEVYNCASLVGKGVHGMGKLTECTVQADKISSASARTEGEQKAVFTAYTSGHNKNGVL